MCLKHSYMTKHLCLFIREDAVEITQDNWVTWAACVAHVWKWLDIIKATASSDRSDGRIVSFVKCVIKFFNMKDEKGLHSSVAVPSFCIVWVPGVFIIIIIIQANKGTVTYCIACWTSKQRSRSVTPLFESHWLWHSGMKTASCDSWSLRLSAKELFKAVQVHCQWLPGKTDARTALKDSSLAQSLGTEIEAHLWQNICDITHHGGNLRREGRWKTQVAYSINPTYWKCSRTCTLEECSTVNSKHICDCFYF